MKKLSALKKPVKTPFVPSDMPTICLLEVVVMPSGEILCLGQHLGWASRALDEHGRTMGHYLTKKESRT